MTTRRIVFATLCALGSVFSATPAYAFLDGLASLRQEFNMYAEEQGDITDLEPLLRTIDTLGEPAASFIDVPHDHWAAAYIDRLAALRLVSGYTAPDGSPTGNYGPGDPVTVAAALKIGIEAAQVDVKMCTPLTDLKIKGHWAALYYSCAKDLKMRVLAKGTLKLDRPITRAEFLAVMHDAFGVSVPDAVAPFTDSARHPYSADIALAVEEGLVDAPADAAAAFNPNGTLNRAQFAKIVTIVLENDAREEVLAKRGQQ